MTEETGSIKTAAIATLASALIRIIGRSLRYEFEDAAHLLDREVSTQYIWTHWHNRALLIPYLRGRFFEHRNGAALTSASRDGALVASVLKKFDIESVRGSSSRRGAAALIAMKKWVERGVDTCITPDGPRGPRYTLNPGLVALSAHTGVPIVPIGLDFTRCWRLRTWDGFIIPKPLALCTVRTGLPLQVDPAAFANDITAETEKVRHALMAVTRME